MLYRKIATRKNCQRTECITDCELLIKYDNTKDFGDSNCKCFLKDILSEAKTQFSFIYRPIKRALLRDIFFCVENIQITVLFKLFRVLVSKSSTDEDLRSVRNDLMQLVLLSSDCLVMT